MLQFVGDVIVSIDLLGCDKTDMFLMFGSFLIIYRISVSANLCRVDHLESLDCHDITEILLKVALNTINRISR